jgi:hypothetical protein
LPESPVIINLTTNRAVPLENPLTSQLDFQRKILNTSQSGDRQDERSVAELLRRPELQQHADDEPGGNLCTVGTARQESVSR